MNPENLTHEIRAFHEHLRTLCGEKMLTRPFGKMLARFVNQQIGGRIFERDYDAENNARYRLVAVNDRPINPNPTFDVTKEDQPAIFGSPSEILKCHSRMGNEDFREQPGSSNSDKHTVNRVNSSLKNRLCVCPVQLIDPG